MKHQAYHTDFEPVDAMFIQVEEQKAANDKTKTAI